MLPTQILLNNLLYDASEMAIPTDNVDEEQLQRPAHWDTAFIRRFMTFFGPISSIFDFATFGIMIWVFNAHAPLFRSGWFVESLATQSLIIFAIRTHRVPFFHGTPSTPSHSQPPSASRSACCCRSPRSPTCSGSSRSPPASSPRSRS
jgi:Mg2+-importing ATPase